ncbi:MAG TPA: YqgE/AlgH family protein [Jatrophihabitans sp.]|jgi:putative transcriptional regulator|nr:YqgE/AlgH family protein [Jatrophihabitans sp.]
MTAEDGWQLAPAAHRLLIATPELSDPEFFRTVVFLIEHDATGTVGVIINRPSHTPVGHVLPEWQDVMSEPAVVFNGGPVQRDGALGLGRLAGSTDAGTGLRAVSGGLALVDLDAPAAEVSRNADSLRVFAGHAGWEVGQLDHEIDSGGWFVVAGSLDDVFSRRPGTLWRSVLRRQPMPLALLSTYPVDVGLN